MTAKTFLHLQLSLLKHKVRMFKSPCTHALCSQMCNELCQLLLAVTFLLAIYSIIPSILKGTLYSNTGKLGHHFTAVERAAGNFPDKFLKLQNFVIPATLQKNPKPNPNNQTTQPNFEEGRQEESSHPRRNSFSNCTLMRWFLGAS